MLKEKLLLGVASFKSVEMWMHAAHHLTKGPAFIAAHELLYGRIYQTFSEDYDKLIEKIVYLANDETMACPIMISSAANAILSRYDSPANLSEQDISMLALVLLVDHIKGIESFREILRQHDMLSLGMEDFLTSAANQYESYAYMINQHVKR